MFAEMLGFVAKNVCKIGLMLGRTENCKFLCLGHACVQLL